MRIGFDAKRATHNFRGLGNYARSLIEGLVQYQPAQELFLYSPLIKSHQGKNWANAISNKVTFKYPPTTFGHFAPSFWRSFLMGNDLKKDQLDIFHGLSHEIPYGLKGAMPFKKIVTIHDLIFIRYPEFFPFIDRLVYFQKFTYACKHADLVIAICNQTKEDLIQLLGVDQKKIVVHYQSCSPDFYQPLDQQKTIATCQKYNLLKPFILNVGAFEPRKNQLNLLQAYALIAHQIDEDLVLIGQGKEYKEKLKQKIKDLDLNLRVHILDSILYDELPFFYQASKIFCYPSLFEGFGIPNIEALFSKVPVITSTGSCFFESAGPNSLFVDPLSIANISEALLKVLSSKNLQQEMSEKGYQFVQRFHRQETTKKLQELYRYSLYR